MISRTVYGMTLRDLRKMVIDTNMWLDNAVGFCDDAGLGTGVGIVGIWCFVPKPASKQYFSLLMYNARMQFELY